ncbi:MAG TPA: pyruvate ferredoxin oxidoreductase, partial [Pseudothermotoga sp.]|nr:pyruvate ferredoxin oxidoreductase [Pseudothermotoga sp.]
KSSLYEVASKPLLGSFVYGLGGRDVNPELIRYAFEKAISHELVADQELYLGLRE